MKNYIYPLLIAFVLLSACATEKPEAQKYVRKNAHSPAAQADLDALRVAIAKMKQLDCSNPTSWYYQGAIHHIPDSIWGPNKLCASYQTAKDSKAGFSTCPHMRPGLTQFHFLTWHRLYIMYWERIVRHYSGKADFALPYWDYNDPAQRTMPEKYRLPASYSANPIYEENRSRLLLSGKPIQPNDSDGIVMNINGQVTQVCNQSMAGALDTTNLWEARNIHLFSIELEDGTHNTIHDYVGGAVDRLDVSPPIYNRIYQNMNEQGLMADVPSAGFDPIFFAHHANIDRLWMMWENDHPAKALTWKEFEQAGEWPYIFFMPDGTKIVYKSMKQVFDSIRAVDYTYDYMLGKDESLAASTPEELNMGSEVMMLNNTQPLPAAGASYTMDLPQALNKDKGYYSMEIKVSFAKSLTNHLAILITGDSVPGEAALCDKYLAGVAGFFGSDHKHAGMDDHSGHGDHHAADNGRLTKLLKYDVTDELRESGAINGRKVHVNISQTRPNEANPFYIESITLKYHP